MTQSCIEIKVEIQLNKEIMNTLEWSFELNVLVDEICFFSTKWYCRTLDMFSPKYLEVMNAKVAY